jgi:hypothetical protein
MLDTTGFLKNINGPFGLSSRPGGVSKSLASLDGDARIGIKA